MRRWLGPLVVAALGFGVLAGGIWYRVDVPVVQVAGPASTVTVSLPPQTAVETRTAVATVTATPEQAPAKREVITQVRQVKPETVTVTKVVDAETVTKTRAREAETETVTVTRTPDEVLQANLPERGRGGN